MLGARFPSGASSLHESHGVRGLPRLSFRQFGLRKRRRTRTPSGTRTASTPVEGLHRAAYHSRSTRQEDHIELPSGTCPPNA